MGPMLVLPAMQKSGPLPVEELPPLLNKISRPALYGSQWRSGVKDRGTCKNETCLIGPITFDNQVSAEKGGVQRTLQRNI